MATYKLVNDFHHTVAHVRTDDRMLNLRQVLRAQKKLCDVYNCDCGGYAGERGGRYFVDLYWKGPDNRQGDSFILMDREEYERMMREAGENWAGPTPLEEQFPADPFSTSHGPTVLK